MIRCSGWLGLAPMPSLSFRWTKQIVCGPASAGWLTPLAAHVDHSADDSQCGDAQKQNCGRCPAECNAANDQPHADCYEQNQECDVENHNRVKRLTAQSRSRERRGQEGRRLKSRRCSNMLRCRFKSSVISAPPSNPRAAPSPAISSKAALRSAVDPEKPNPAVRRRNL